MFETEPLDGEETMMLQMAKQLGLRIATDPDPSTGAQRTATGSTLTTNPEAQRSLHDCNDRSPGLSGDATPSPGDSYPTTPRNQTLRGAATDTGGQPSNTGSSRLASHHLTDIGAYGRCNSEPLPEDFVRRFFSSSSSNMSRPQSPMAPGKRGRLEEAVVNRDTGAGGKEQLLQDPPGSPSTSRRRLLPGDSRRLQENLAAKEAFAAAASKVNTSAPAALSMCGDSDPLSSGPHHVRRTFDGSSAEIPSLSHTSSSRGSKPNAVSLFNRFLVHRNTWDGAREELPSDLFPGGSTRSKAEEERQAAREEGADRAASSLEAQTRSGDASVPVLQSQVRSLQEELQEAQLQLAASQARAEADAARIASLEKQLESVQQQVGSWRKLYLETLPRR